MRRVVPRFEIARAQLVAAATVTVMALAWYVLHACPTVCTFGDSATFATAAVSGGVAQPSGYPLWTALARLAALPPVGDPAWRVNLTSAVYHAVAVGAAALIAMRHWGSVAAAVGGAGFLAFSRTFLQGSLYAEVFPLNDLMAVLLIGMALEIHRERDERRAGRWLLGMAAAVGLASAHHQIIVLLAPCLAWLLFPTCRRVLGSRPRLLAACFALWLAPMLVLYGALLLVGRGDPWSNWGDVRSLGGLWSLFSRADYGGPFSAALATKGDGAWQRVSLHLGTSFAAFGPLGIGLALVGIAWLWRNHRSTAVAVCLAWLAAGPLFSAMNTIPSGSASEAAFLSRFDSMAHCVLGLALCAGTTWLVQVLSDRGLARPLVRLLAGGVCIASVAAHADVDLSDDRFGAALSRDLVASASDTALVLLSGDATLGPAAWQCAVQRACGSRVVISPGQLHLAWRVAQLRRRHPDLALPHPTGDFITTRELIEANLPNRPVYLVPAILDREPVLRERFHYVPAGLLLRAVERQEDLVAARSSFLQRAEALASGTGIEGLAHLRGGAIDPLQHQAVALYGTALENHGRIASLVFGEPHLGDQLHARAEAVLALVK